MAQLPEPLERLISELSRLPGVGPKTAQRLAFHMLRTDRQRADSLAQAIIDMKARITYCERCYNISEGGLCVICASTRRDASLLCVVEEPLDVLAVERTSEFFGLYFVLQGPRRVATYAVWAGDEDRILFYDSQGQRFAQTRLCEAPDPRQLA